MWAFIFLYIAGSDICQATVEGNSTQMHYSKLIVDISAIKKISELLASFEVNSPVHVNDLQMTTSCTNDSHNKDCTCKEGYKWSEEVCLSNDKCCDNENCIFPKESSHMCVSNSSVTIKGSIRFTNVSYQKCMNDKESEQFKECNNKVLKTMKTHYSTLRGFDVLKITEYRIGSVIAEFEISIANDVTSQQLNQNTQNVAKEMNASLELVSTGFVSLKMPSGLVKYNSETDIVCSTQTSLSGDPVWQLERHKIKNNITTGTQSTLKTTGRSTTLKIKNISDVWAGNYTCAYNEVKTSFRISHQASGILDVCLLPRDIEITTFPAFPHCTSDSQILPVEGRCEIKSSTENYNVTWSKVSINYGLKEVKPTESNGQTVYAVTTYVDCNDPKKTPKLTCTFRNRCNQTKNASTNINIIPPGEKPCLTEGPWETTKAGFTAKIKCKDAAGQIQRKCSENATWGEVEEMCLNSQVKSLLQKAETVGNGLGTKDENAASVFTDFKHITNKTGAINSPDSINASVFILSTMKTKLDRMENNSTVNDFLETSSNLLEKSLSKSWIEKRKNSYLTVGEEYLQSVEYLVKITNPADVKQVSNLKKSNLELAICSKNQSSSCKNSVFDVTVTLHGSANGTVKTTGFKQLQNYLPKTDGFTPNSIVVSTTIEDKTDIDVKLDFNFTDQRNRNVVVRCVSWDNITQTWSDEGCEWESFDDKKGVCVCKHLSSFAVLMSKDPLNVTGLHEITYVGLSISVVSLVISLIIEMIVWNAVVKTNTLYLRHAAHVNISLCLLVANCCFLASSEPKKLPEIWCKTFVVLKHFCYLSMFFWMFCLSTTVLHQAVFLFHNLSKKYYLRSSLVVGYVCPLLIVVITFIANNGESGQYYDKDTCWLVYKADLEGSIHTFIIPVGIIVIINVFSMLVVIIKLLDHPVSTDKSNEKERTAAKTVMRSVILLTPIFGVTWIFGFGMMFLDLAHGKLAYAVSYIFTLLNSFQGFFILLTTCLADKLTRDALLNRIKKNTSTNTVSERFSNTSDSSWKK